MKYMECMDEKRTISAYYHEKLRSGARVGIKRMQLPEEKRELHSFHKEEVKIISNSAKTCSA